MKSTSFYTFLTDSYVDGHWLLRNVKLFNDVTGTLLVNSEEMKEVSVYDKNDSTF